MTAFLVGAKPSKAAIAKTGEVQKYAGYLKVLPVVLPRGRLRVRGPFLPRAKASIAGEW